MATTTLVMIRSMIAEQTVTSKTVLWSWKVVRTVVITMAMAMMMMRVITTLLGINVNCGEYNNSATACYIVRSMSMQSFQTMYGHFV